MLLSTRAGGLIAHRRLLSPPQGPETTKAAWVSRGGLRSRQIDAYATAYVPSSGLPSCRESRSVYPRNDSVLPDLGAR